MNDGDDNHRSEVAVVVLAAGRGSRYGGLKQLAPIGGTPMLTRVLEVLDGVGEPQVVVLGCEAQRARAAVPEGRWQVVLANDWEAGPGASLRAGLRAAPRAAAAIVVLGDLPWLRREAVTRVIAAARQSIPEIEVVRAFDGTNPGHPLLLRGTALGAARSAPDGGLRGALPRERMLAVRCEGLGVAEDADTPPT